MKRTTIHSSDVREKFRHTGEKSQTRINHRPARVLAPAALPGQEPGIAADDAEVKK